MKQIKRLASLLVSVFVALIPFVGNTESASENDTESWKTKPVITTIYEKEQGKIYLQWEGQASLYGIYIDGAQKEIPNVPQATQAITVGTHEIRIIPLKTLKMEFGGNVDSEVVTGGLNITIPVGMEPGEISDAVYIDYYPDSVFTTEVKAPTAFMNPDNTVSLSFYDDYGYDEYVITVKSGNDIGYIHYVVDDFIEKNDNDSDDSNNDMQINGNTVTIRLDPEYLRSNQCMAIRMGQKYSFSLQMRKKARDYVTGSEIATVLHTSKEGAFCEFTPFEYWTYAPVITAIEQTGEGEVKLTWSHEKGETDGDVTYQVVEYNQLVGVNLNYKIVEKTEDTTIVLKDIKDGEHSYSVRAVIGETEGNLSEQKKITVKNTWNKKPEISTETISSSSCKITWPVSSYVNKYHVKAFVADTGSLLRFVGMNYNLDFEQDVDVTDSMSTAEFVYEYKGEDASNLKLKFEVYGVHVNQDGTEQNSETTIVEYELK